MKFFPLMFQCLFYTGSWVQEHRYKPLIDRIKTHPDVENIRFHQLFQKPPENRNDTILIGHSLGGYFALQDAKKYPERVAGVILLNSHFNSRGVMPYPGTALDDIEAPVLTILGGQDDRLPIQKALDDAWQCVQEKEADKFFHVNKDYTHWTGVTETYGQDNIVASTHEFISALSTRNFTEMRMLDLYRKRFRPDIYHLSMDAVIASQSVNVIDAIIGLVVSRSLWKMAHFLWFLTTKPDDDLSYLFVGDDHIFLKGKEQDEKNYGLLLRQWTRDVPVEIHDYYLPTIHPSILFWLGFPLQPRWKNNKIIAPRLVLEVNDKTTYYKIPNPRKFFPLLPPSSFFDF